MKNISSLLKTTFITTLALNSLYGYATGDSTTTKESPHVIDKVVAIVNDNVITNSELVSQTNKITQQYKNNKEELPPINELRKQLLNAMILDDLQLQLADSNKISASDEQIASAIENLAKQNKVDVYTFKQMLLKQGIDFNEFKKDLNKKLTIMNVQRAAVHSQVKVSDRELAQALSALNAQNSNTRYRISHILVSVPNEPSSETIKYAKDRAEDLIKQLSDGKSFNSLAKIASDGQQALDGGDLGWFNQSQLPAVIADVAPKMKKGEIFGPIQSENGFHIIKLADVQHSAKQYLGQKYKVRHILIKKDDITTDAIAKKELLRLKKEIEQKNNFSDLALIYSEDYGTASNGGSLGWIPTNAVVPEFAHTMTNLKVNQISEPFQTSYGWHIAQVLDVKVEDTTEQRHEMHAKQMIEQRKFQDAIAKWQNKLRSEAHIKILI